MNKQTGNMYPFVTHTWNPIRGKCPHECLYCYMAHFPQKEMRIEPKALTEDLGIKHFIFVGSSTDMWAKEVPAMWIEDVLAYCDQFQNWYLFQTKNPERFTDTWTFPPLVILGTTLESNRCWNGSKAPCPIFRYQAMKSLTYRKMVSIEPIMDFDLDEFLDMIRGIQPQFVSIGADSKNHNLPEPSADKVQRLIAGLSAFTKVKLKDNLKRIGKIPQIGSTVESVV